MEDVLGLTAACNIKDAGSALAAVGREHGKFPVP